MPEKDVYQRLLAQTAACAADCVDGKLVQTETVPQETRRLDTPKAKTRGLQFTCFAGAVPTSSRL